MAKEQIIPELRIYQVRLRTPKGETLERTVQVCARYMFIDSRGNLCFSDVKSSLPHESTPPLVALFQQCDFTSVIAL